MIPRLISSLQHPLVKKMVKLREERSFREQERSLLIVGETVVREIAENTRLKALITSTPLNIPAEKYFIALPEVIQKIIGHKTGDLVAAEIAMPPPSDLTSAHLIVVLDQIADPGNMGTIFRTSLALGWGGIFVIKGSADPYNDKTLRASRAAPLKLPWCEGTWDDLDTTSRQVVVAHTSGTPLSQMKFSKPLLLVLGHETKGPSITAQKLGTCITIPLQGKMESLNVASAASILLYQIQQDLS